MLIDSVFNDEGIKDDSVRRTKRSGYSFGSLRVHFKSGEMNVLFSLRCTLTGNNTIFALLSGVEFIHFVDEFDALTD